MQENMINEEAVNKDEEIVEEKTAKNEKADKKKIKALEKELEVGTKVSLRKKSICCNGTGWWNGK